MATSSSSSSLSSDRIALSVTDQPGELVVRVVTVEHKKTHLKHHHHPSHPPLADGSSSSSNAVPSSTVVTAVTPPPATRLAEDDEKKKKKRRGICGIWWCCPWYMLVALIALIALAIGLGVGLTGKENKGTTVTDKRYNLDLKFNVFQKEVNITLISSLRCVVANLTDPTQFNRILMTSWEEYNGTVYFVEDNHPLNAAKNCSQYFPSNGVPDSRRRLQQINNTWIYPIDPITVNISAVPPPDDNEYKFIDKLYESEKLSAVAQLQAMQQLIKDGPPIPLPPSATSTSTPTPSNTPTSSETPTSSNTPTPTSTGTSTGTPTSSVTPTASTSSSSTPSSSNTPTSSSTPSNTPSSTVSASPTPSSTVSASPTPSSTVSASPTPSTTPSQTGTGTPTSTCTPTPSRSPSSVPTPFVVDINTGIANSDPSGFTAFAGKVFFKAKHASTGIELYAADATDVWLVKDLNSNGDGNPYSFTPISSTQMLFRANDGVKGGELWTTGGTGATTMLLKDIQIGSGSSDPILFTFFKKSSQSSGIWFFVCDDGINGQEWYTTDGTASSTLLFKDLNPGSGGSKPNYPIVYNDYLYFQAEVNGDVELYYTDGTSANTIILVNLNPSGSSYPQLMTIVGNQFFFTCTDGSNGMEIWKSQGTSVSTVMLMDIRSGSVGSSPNSFNVIGDKLFFLANDGIVGAELWVTDGTNTNLVVDLHPSGTPQASDFVVYRNELYFTATTPTTGFELFKTNGSAAGTVLVADVAAGATDANPCCGIVYRDQIFLQYDEPSRAGELWTYSGAQNKVFRVKDIYPGSTGSFPKRFYNWNNSYMFFAADDQFKGNELFYLP